MSDSALYVLVALGGTFFLGAIALLFARRKSRAWVDEQGSNADNDPKPWTIRAHLARRYLRPIPLKEAFLVLVCVAAFFLIKWHFQW
jgi:hypothetical protein